MGAIRRSLAPVGPALSGLVAGHKAQQISTSFPLLPPISNPAPREHYEQLAREGYMGNDLVFQCVDFLCTSAADAELAAFRYPGGDRKKRDTVEQGHTVLTLLDRPNPFMTQFQMVAGIRMYRALAGNAYLLKVRSRARKVVQLWLLRPDWVRVVPDPMNYIRGYTYAPFGAPIPIPVEDIIHFKNRHPLDPYYGLPPLAPIAGRVDIDSWMRNLVAAFFKNGGVPIGMLTVKRALEMGEKELIQQKFRRDFGGPSGWFNLAVLDGAEDNEVSYTPMGMPLGERGLVLPDLNDIDEARITGAFGLLPSVVGTHIGLQSSSYANRVADQEMVWQNTLSPLYREDGTVLTMGLQPDFPDVDEIGFDLSNVRALQEDGDKKSARLLDQLKSRVITVEEFRRELGRDPEPAKGETWIYPINLEIAVVGEAAPPPVPETPPADQQAAADQAAADAQATAQDGKAMGDVLVKLDRLEELARKGPPEMVIEKTVDVRDAQGRIRHTIERHVPVVNGVPS